MSRGAGWAIPWSLAARTELRKQISNPTDSSDFATRSRQQDIGTTATTRATIWLARRRSATFSTFMGKLRPIAKKMMRTCASRRARLTDGRVRIRLRGQGDEWKLKETCFSPGPSTRSMFAASPTMALGSIPTAPFVPAVPDRWPRPTLRLATRPQGRTAPVAAQSASANISAMWRKITIPPERTGQTFIVAPATAFRVQDGAYRRTAPDHGGTSTPHNTICPL